MDQVTALKTIDRLYIEMRASWGHKFKVTQDQLQTWRRRWVQTLGYAEEKIVIDAFEQFVNSGKEFPPTLPEFRKAVDDLTKQGKMKHSEYAEIQGSHTPEVAEYYKMVIKRILKVKGGQGFPWLEKVEDATMEQLDVMRDLLSKRGIQVKAAGGFL